MDRKADVLGECPRSRGRKKLCRHRDSNPGPQVPKASSLLIRAFIFIFLNANAFDPGLKGEISIQFPGPCTAAASLSWAKFATSASSGNSSFLRSASSRSPAERSGTRWGRSSARYEADSLSAEIVHVLQPVVRDFFPLFALTLIFFASLVARLGLIFLSA